MISLHDAPYHSHINYNYSYIPHVIFIPVVATSIHIFMFVFHYYRKRKGGCSWLLTPLGLFEQRFIQLSYQLFNRICISQQTKKNANSVLSSLHIALNLSLLYLNTTTPRTVSLVVFVTYYRFTVNNAWRKKRS